LYKNKFVNIALFIIGQLIINHKVLKECTKNAKKYKIKRDTNGTLWTLCNNLVSFVVKK